MTEEPATAILSEPPVQAGGQTPSENATRPLIHTTAAEAEPQSSVDGTLEKQSFSANRAAKPLVAIGLAIILLIGGFFGYRYFRQAGSSISSIAVMPFLNESGDVNVDYLSDGMTETLISGLSQLQDLDVKPRSAVFRYKGKETDPQTIGRELNVQAVLNGRMVERGQDISLYAELIDVARNRTLWSATYNRKKEDLVALQRDVARDVSSRLRSTLSATDEAKVTKTYTTNPDAYALYLKGNFYRAKYTEEGYKKALECYKQAIDIDPNYALAYVGIAGAYNVASEWYMAPSDAMPLAKSYLQKALSLDDSIAVAHMRLGSMLVWYDRDWAQGEREFQRAMEMDNRYRGDPLYLAALGRPDDAIAAVQSKLRDDPLDLTMNDILSGVLNLSGRYDEAIARSRKTLEIDPNFWAAYSNIGRAYIRKGQYPEAIAALEKATSLSNNPEIRGYLGYAYAAAGRTGDARRLIGELNEVSKQRYVSPYPTAVIYAGLNEKDRAFEWLERSIDVRSYAVVLLKVEPLFEGLRSDVRFQQLLKRLNRPE